MVDIRNPHALRIEKAIKVEGTTILGIGPVSKNVVDATLDLVNQFDIPILLIASRRQIECKELGGGYVENWSTEDFAKYVKQRDKNKKIILARDHGGPWQNNFEIENKFSISEAMISCKKSFHADLHNGFDMIHIDPSIELHGHPKISDIIDRSFDLFEYCNLESKLLNSRPLFEVGTEEIKDHDQLEKMINLTFDFCTKTGFELPTFFVANTGTKVLETENVGTFEENIKSGSINYIQKLTQICDRHGVFLKEHNADYLSEVALKMHPRLHIHSANVAPEFGVTETRAFLNILKKIKRNDLIEKFRLAVLASNKWSKWLKENSHAGLDKKTDIAGHYLFASDFFKELKYSAEKTYQENIDVELQSCIKSVILKYLKCFNYKLSEV